MGKDEFDLSGAISKWSRDGENVMRCAAVGAARGAAGHRGGAGMEEAWDGAGTGLARGWRRAGTGLARGWHGVKKDDGCENMF